MAKAIIAVAFAMIIGSLGSALFYLMRDKGKSGKTVRALSFRVGFSVLLFLGLLVAHQLGWVQTNSF